MSSRIYKSSQLNVSQPKIINISHEFVKSQLVDEKQISANEINVLDQPLEFNFENMQSENLDEVSNQAKEILTETEQMVKELMTTAKNEAERIITEAREKAEQTLAESKEQGEKIKEVAHKESYQKGYTEGKSLAEAETSKDRETAKKIIEDAYLEKEKIVRSSESELLQLASAIAQKVIQQELKTEPEIIVNIVREALKKVYDREELNLVVNPENMDTILNVQDQLTAETKGIKKLKIIGDAAVAVGGCVIETSNAKVDARVERQLAEIEQSLMDVNNSG